MPSHVMTVVPTGWYHCFEPRVASWLTPRQTRMMSASRQRSDPWLGQFAGLTLACSSISLPPASCSLSSVRDPVPCWGVRLLPPGLYLWWLAEWLGGTEACGRIWRLRVGSAVDPGLCPGPKGTVLQERRERTVGWLSGIPEPWVLGLGEAMDGKS